MICPICKKRERKKHWNGKYCEECALEKRRRPASSLNEFQKRKVRKLAGKVPQVEIQKILGVGKSALQRFGREEGFYYLVPKYSQKTIDEVIGYYVKWGKVKTEKAFPKVKVRSIVERYAHIPRQSKWTEKELVLLSKMAGLVSMEAQARYFNRPNAHGGSIQSAWMKKYKVSGSQINGLSWSIAREFVRPICPIVKTEFWRQNPKNKRGANFSRTLVLWVDLENHLRENIPEHIKRGISALAKFQRWLHGKNVHEKVQDMIERIEYGNQKFSVT